jgi:predicted HAD superfamily hydrolase
MTTTSLVPKDYTFYTFDFFDTLFHRSAGHWLEFYRQLAKRYQSEGIIPGGDDIIELFVSERISSEDKARKHHLEAFGNPEIKLEDVYTVLCKRFPFTAGYEQSRLAELEFAADSAMLTPNAMLINNIKELCAGYGVVSDTFYRSDQLSSVLKAHDLNPEFIYASCEHGDGKHSSLFKKVTRRLRDSSGQLPNAIHIGDNYHSDYLKPIEHGLDALHIPYGDSLFWQRETSAQEWSKEYFGESSINDIPVARMVSAIAQGPGILVNKNLSFDQHSHYEYGYRCIGPLMTSFSVWLAEICRKLEPDAVLFMMREGEILHTFFEAASKDSKTITNKFFISRKVAAQAAVFEGTEEELGSLNFASKNQTLGEFIKLAGISSDYGTRFISESFPGCTNKPCIQILPDVIKLIRNEHSILSEVLEHSELTRKGMLRHLENLLSPLKISDISSLVIADVGWNGTIQKFLNKILEATDSTSHIRLTGAYFLTTSAASPNSIGFLASHGHPSIPTTLFMRSPEIIEQCSSSTRFGTTIGYTPEGQPVTRNISTSPQLKDIERVQQGALDFANFAFPYLSLMRSEADSQAVKSWHFSHLLRQTCIPLKGEIKLFSSWHHDDNLIKDDNTTICVKALEPWLSSAPYHLLPKIAMDECYWPYPLLSTRICRPRDFINFVDNHNPCSTRPPRQLISGSIILGGLNYRHSEQISAVYDADGNAFVEAKSILNSKALPYRISINLNFLDATRMKVAFLYFQYKNQTHPVSLSLNEADIYSLTSKNIINITNTTGDFGEQEKKLYRELMAKKGCILMGSSFINWIIENDLLKHGQSAEKLKTQINHEIMDDESSVMYFKMILSKLD